MNDTDKKEQLPVHIILRASDFAKIELEKSPRVGKISEPFAELTKMGWETMSLGRESDVVFALYTQTSVIMKNCVVLISWVYKKAITMMIICV